MQKISRVAVNHVAFVEVALGGKKVRDPRSMLKVRDTGQRCTIFSHSSSNQLHSVSSSYLNKSGMLWTTLNPLLSLISIPAHTFSVGACAVYAS